MFELRWLIIVDKFKSLSATGLPENKEKKILQYRKGIQGTEWPSEWQNVPETRTTSK